MTDPRIRPFFEYKGMKWDELSSEKSIDEMKDFQVRDDDVFIATYPRCGTHWTKEMINLLLHEGDPAAFRRLPTKYHMEFLVSETMEDLATRKDELQTSCGFLKDAPSPRVMSTHVTPEFLPSQVWEKQRPITLTKGLDVYVIYVVREPKSVMVSFHEFLLPYGLFPKDLEEFIKVSCDGEIIYGSYADHLRSFGKVLKDRANILLVSYKELKEDLETTLRKIAKFLKIEVSDAGIKRTVENAQIDKMKESIAQAEVRENHPLATFMAVHETMRHGNDKRWKSILTEEQKAKIDNIFEEKLKDYPELMEKF